MQQLPQLAISCIIVSVVFWLLSLVAIALRFLARRRTDAKLGWNDWTIVFALVGRVLFLCDLKRLFMAARSVALVSPPPLSSAPPMAVSERRLVNWIKIPKFNFSK